MNSDFTLGPDETQQITPEDLAFRITGLVHKCQLSMRGVQKFACTSSKLPKGVRRVAINRYFLKPLYLSLKAEIVDGNKIPMAKLQAKYHEHGVIDEFQTAVKCLRQLSRFEKDQLKHTIAKLGKKEIDSLVLKIALKLHVTTDRVRNKKPPLHMR